MRYLLDVDGVVARFADRWLDCLRVVSGKCYRPEDVRSWEFRDSLDITPEEEAAVEALLAQNLDFEEDDDWAWFCRRLIRLGHDVVFVTAPSQRIKTWAYERQRWLDARFPGHAGVVHTDAKQWVSGDVLVDDRRENLDAWQKVNPNGRTVLVPRPWNR